MGSTCSGPRQTCPEHPTDHITTICLHPRCIEPLCQQCLANHRNQHQQLGTPPQLQPLSQVAKDMQTSFIREAHMYEELSEFNESVKQVPTSSLLKELTREYFLKKRGGMKEGVSAVEVVRNLEQAQGLTHSLEAKHMFNAFLKSKIRVNGGVVDQSQKDLY